MRLRNLYINKFFVITIAVQLAVWISIGLNILDPRFLLIRQIICFVYITLIPGIIVIRILKLESHLNMETLLYIVGVSAAIVMWMGIFINKFYFSLGITNPISLLPLMASMTALIFILSLLSCRGEMRKTNNNYITLLIKLASPSTLYLCLIPFVSIIGTYLMNFYQSNLMIIIFILITSLLIVLIGLEKAIPENLYPLAIFVSSISLLFHRSLISQHIWGWDIHSEFYFSQLVIANSYWNTSTFYDINSVPSITILAPIYSIILNTSVIWIYKAMIPFLFSFVPVGLYYSYKNLFNNKISFFSVYFFMSIFSFYGELTVLLRQEIAELFLVLLIVLLLNKKMPSIARSVLIVIFSSSLIVSHYGLAYIYMTILLLSVIIKNFVSGNMISRIRNSISFSREGKTRGAISNYMSSNYIYFYTIFTVTWYVYISDSYVFEVIVKLSQNIINGLFSDFLDPKSTAGLNVLTTGTSSIMYQSLKFLHLITFFFIFIGLLDLIMTKRKSISEEYLSFSITSFGINAGAIIIPFFASCITTTRLYHITLIYLAPFFTIGGLFIYNLVSKRQVRFTISNQAAQSYKALSIFLFIFFLFNIGFIHEITHDKNPTSISLNSTYDFPRFNEMEIDGAKWLGDKISNSAACMADPFGAPLLYEYIFPRWRMSSFKDDTENTSRGSLIFFRNLNVNDKILSSTKNRSIERPYGIVDLKNSIFYNNVLINKSKIYNNKGSEVWL